LIPVVVAGVWIDRRRKHAAALQLHHGESLWAEIPEPVHVLDHRGRVIFWNLGAEQLYGIPAGEMAGRDADATVGAVIADPDVDQIHHRGYRDATRWKGEILANAADGHSLRLERRRTKVLDGDRCVGVVVFDLDLGERDRLQQLDRRRQRLESLGTLASGIAHDLNNLLTPILMSSKMLQRETPGVDRNALLETIGTGASRGADLISQLLTFARGGEGRRITIDACNLLHEITTILERTLPKDIQLIMDFDAPVPPIAGDETEISQVVMNLAINARDAMPEGGQLKISAGHYCLSCEQSFSFSTLPPGDYLQIQVSDSGQGIPPELQDRIFDPFFSTKERGQGTGLGLSTTLGIVKSHQGAISVQSDGAGTTLSVLLPAVDPASVPTANQSGT